MQADFQFNFSNTKSRSGCEKKVFIKIPKSGGQEGHVVLTLGTLSRISFNTTTPSVSAYALGRKSALHEASGVSSCFGVLVFSVIDTSTIEYLKNQIEEITGEKYIDAYKIQDLPPFDIILISADENDTSGRFSKRIIKGVTIDSESGATGADILQMTEEYTFKAIKIGELTAEEVKIYSPFLNR